MPVHLKLFHCAFQNKRKKRMASLYFQAFLIADSRKGSVPEKALPKSALLISTHFALLLASWLSFTFSAWLRRVSWADGNNSLHGSFLAKVPQKTFIFLPTYRQPWLLMFDAFSWNSFKQASNRWRSCGHRWLLKTFLCDWFMQGWMGGFGDCHWSGRWALSGDPAVLFLSGRKWSHCGSRLSGAHRL